jgi:hypothetical protein
MIPHEVCTTAQLRYCRLSSTLFLLVELLLVELQGIDHSLPQLRPATIYDLGVR